MNIFRKNYLTNFKKKTMKNYLLLVIFSLFVYGISQAQLTSDNFDGYNTGPFDGQFQPGEWTGWGGGASNGIITAEQAFSGDQSLKIWDNAGTESDAVALLGTLSTGVENISFMQYIPSSGTGAYYNLQHNYTNAAGDWAADVYFGTSPAAGEITTDGVVYPFTPIFDAWVEQKFILDFTNSQGEFYYDGTLVHTWVLNTNSAGGAGLNTINAVNFYAANIGAGANSLAYYDDFAVLIPPVVVLTSDNFDGYNTGPFDGQFQAGEWTGWAGGASNGIITAEQAFSGAQSLKIWDNAGTESDVVGLLGTLSTGVENISFMQYIPSSGTGAYYNLQHNYTNAAGDWAADVYFGTSPAAGEITTDGVVYPFTPIFDAWVEQKFILDFTNSQGEFYYDGTLVHTWVLNTNSAGGAGLNTINAVNFYAANIGAGANSLAYYDDFGVLMPVSTTQIKPFDGTLEINPNPTTGFTTLNVEMDDANDIKVVIFDMTGKLIQSFNGTNVRNRKYSIDLSNQPNGIYLVHLMTNGQMETKKVVVNN
ncbi:MAG: hypothetical protein ACI8P3_001646 [Saprospiraceae bacterium]|jgi:hypothetical protein